MILRIIEPGCPAIDHGTDHWSSWRRLAKDGKLVVPDLSEQIAEATDVEEK